MPDHFLPERFTTALRTQLYRSLFQNETIVFSKPTSNKSLQTKDPLYHQYSPYSITRTGTSALNITSVNTIIRTEALPHLVSLVTFDLGSRESVQHFRDTFPVEMRTTVERVIIHDNAAVHFSLPTTKLAWPALRSLTISGVKVKQLSLLQQGVSGIMPSIDTITSTPCKARTFKFQTTALVDEDCDAVINMDNSPRAMTLTSPCSLRGLRDMKREEYQIARALLNHGDMQQNAVEEEIELEMAMARVGITEEDLIRIQVAAMG